MLDRLAEKGFDVLPLHHANAILVHDMSGVLTDLEAALVDIELPIEELIRGGGGEGQLTQRIRRKLNDVLGWKKHRFEVVKIVDGEPKEAISHEVDHVKTFGDYTCALEIEWNNKDPFFDRDLENYKRLHADGVISIGVIITRGRSFQDSIRDHIEKFAQDNAIDSLDKLLPFYTPTSRQSRNIERQTERFDSFRIGWANAFVADKFGEATTHWRKLEDRVSRGVGNPCPLLLIGIPGTIISH